MRSGDPGGDRWEQIERLFTEALDLPAAARKSFLDRSCRGDAALRDEVESLLEAAEEAPHYFDTLSRGIGLHPAEPHPPLRDLEGRRIGAYRLVRLLGRGGMGAVFLAERDDGHFDKRVALKLLPVGMATEEARRRFRAERRLLARLEHPNIARLIDGGITEDATPYFVLELVEGTRIDEYCRLHNPAVPDRLELFVQVLNAVGHAHQLSIVHRDLKPANILVSDHGQVKLLDFGIAKLLDEVEGGGPATLSRSGGHPMTPRYASPEQLSEQPVSAATDVYTLGVLLYELLTGTQPYELDGCSTEQVRRIVCGRDPDPPSGRMFAPAPRASMESVSPAAGRLRRRRAGVLDAIVLKALRKEPERRYSTATEFADDLRRHLAGEPVRARRLSWVHRGRRSLGQHRLALSIPVIAVLTALILTDLQPEVALPVLAIGSVQDHTGPAASGAAIFGVLATQLGALPGIRLVSNERMEEVRAQVGGDSATGARLIAIHAGALQVIEGEIWGDSLAGFRLDFRRVDAHTGRVRDAGSVASRDVPELARLSVAHLTRKLKLRPPAEGMASLAVPAMVAQHMYNEGLRAYYQRDLSAAERLFSNAFAEDSTFAMAAYYLWRTRQDMGIAQRGDTTLTRSVRLARQASEREQILIRAMWARSLQDPAFHALADTLAVRYPLEPDGHLLRGEAMVSRGDFLGAIPHFTRVIAMDSLSLRARTPLCRACDAFRGAFNAYALADSAAAGERLAREWIGLQPTSPHAWRTLSDALVAQGRYDEALTVRHHAASIRAGDAVEPIFRVQIALRTGQWVTADRLLDDIVQASSRELRREALWWRAISLREQGRLREALSAATEYREIVTSSRGDRDQGPPYTAVIQAQIMLELGDARRAAALFDSIALNSVAPESRGWTARAQAWVLTHEATALAAAGDTAALTPLAQRVRDTGAESGFGRDWRLHNYVQGLLLSRRGKPAEAERAFRLAVYSLRSGFGRNNLELSRTLLDLRRPNDAVDVLSPLLRSGPIEAGNLYVSRTDLHAELGRAWEMAGRPDSAAIHYQWVLNAWIDADPSLHDRREAVRARLTALNGG